METALGLGRAGRTGVAQLVYSTKQLRRRARLGLGGHAFAVNLFTGTDSCFLGLTGCTRLVNNISQN
jgi:hypothetical protein